MWATRFLFLAVAANTLLAKFIIYSVLACPPVASQLHPPVRKDRGRPAATPLPCGDSVVATGKLGMRIAMGLATILAIFVIAPASKAQTSGIAGKYQCTQVKARGKVKPCSSAQLNLKADGRFELRGWEGDYSVSGAYVELSDKSVKSKARLEPGYKLIFKYKGKDGVVEVTYERRQSAPANEALS